MKLVLISDTHDLHDEINIPDGDVLIHAGDMTSYGTVNQLVDVNNWLKSLPHKHKILIPGNHDFLFEKDFFLAQSIMTEGIILLNSSTIINNVKFYGSPQTPRFYDWAFNKDRGVDIKKYWDAIPKDTDVLITHGPPYGIGDVTYRSGHIGCSDLLDAVRIIKPKVHVFGHIHAGYGEYDSLGTKFVNASICTENYHALNHPIVVDL